MPLGTAKVVGFPVEQDAVGGIVKVIIPTADALIARLQQVFMLVDHAEAEMAVEGYDEFGECHLVLFSIEIFPDGYGFVAELKLSLCLSDDSQNTAFGEGMLFGNPFGG